MADLNTALQFDISIWSYCACVPFSCIIGLRILYLESKERAILFVPWLQDDGRNRMVPLRECVLLCLRTQLNRLYKLGRKQTQLRLREIFFCYSRRSGA